MTEDNQPEQVSWNLSQALLAEIAGLLLKASNYYVSGNYWQSFDCLKAAKLRFIQSLKQNERDMFVEQEKIIINLLKFHHPQLANSNPNLWCRLRGVISSEVDRYNIMLMDTLNKYGYLIKAQEDSKRMF